MTFFVVNVVNVVIDAVVVVVVVDVVVVVVVGVVVVVINVSVVSFSDIRDKKIFDDSADFSAKLIWISFDGSKICPKQVDPVEVKMSDSRISLSFKSVVIRTFFVSLVESKKC